MPVAPARLARLRNLQRVHALVLAAGGVAAATAIAGLPGVAAAAALLVVTGQIFSLEIIRETLLTDGEKHR